MFYTKQATTTVTTMNLCVGDVVEIGNMFDGFSTYTIQEIAPSAYSKTKIAVTILFNHGGSHIEYSGKNTHWSVVKVGA